jgi:hypothetical protein
MAITPAQLNAIGALGTEPIPGNILDIVRPAVG